MCGCIFLPRSPPWMAPTNKKKPVRTHQLGPDPPSNPVRNTPRRESFASPTNANITPLVSYHPTRPTPPTGGVKCSLQLLAIHLVGGPLLVTAPASLRAFLSPHDDGGGEMRGGAWNAALTQEHQKQPQQRCPLLLEQPRSTLLPAYPLLHHRHDRFDVAL